MPTESVLFTIVILCHCISFIVFRFFSLLIVYVIGGILINKYKFGVESMPEMCPNYQFWAGIPSLIKVNYAAQCYDTETNQRGQSPVLPDPVPYSVRQAPGGTGYVLGYRAENNNQRRYLMIN